MGRDAGFPAYRNSIGSGAEAIYIPETKTDLQHLFTILEDGWNRKKSSLIRVVTEGDEAGGGFKISKKVKEKFPHINTKKYPPKNFDVEGTMLSGVPPVNAKAKGTLIHISSGGAIACELTLKMQFSLEALNI